MIALDVDKTLRIKLLGIDDGAVDVGEAGAAPGVAVMTRRGLERYTQQHKRRRESCLHGNAGFQLLRLQVCRCRQGA